MGLDSSLDQLAGVKLQGLHYYPVSNYQAVKRWFYAYVKVAAYWSLRGGSTLLSRSGLLSTSFLITTALNFYKIEHFCSSKQVFLY
jgi:hypothetical protein